MLGDEAVVAPGAVLILRDDEDFAMGQVVDLVTVDQGTGSPAAAARCR
jgi:hypothetical protein